MRIASLAGIVQLAQIAYTYSDRLQSKLPFALAHCAQYANEPIVND